MVRVKDGFTKLIFKKYWKKLKIKIYNIKQMATAAAAAATIGISVELVVTACTALGVG